MEQMTVNGKNYQVLSLLGHGKGGYSFLVTDGKTKYVLKQIHHEPCTYYTFGDKLAAELQDYARLFDLDIPLPRLLEVDRAQERILKEYIRGKTIDVLVLDNQMEPDYWKQIHKICQTLYAANLNIDYYPTNFVVQDGRLYYIDYECNQYMEQWNFENWGCKYWSKTPDFLEAFEKRVQQSTLQD